MKPSLSPANESPAAADRPTSVSDEQYIFSYGRALEPKYSNPSIAGYYRPWRFIDKKRSGVSRVFYARSREFRVALDVSQFPPENVVVKLVGDRIVIEAHHPTTDDYLGRISRQLVRKYKTPPDLKLHTVTGKYKRGFLILWAERDFEPAEKPEIGVMADKDGDEEDDESMVQRNASAAQRLKEVTDAKADLQRALGMDAVAGGSVGGRGAGRASRADRAANEEIVVRVRKSSSPSGGRPAQPKDKR